MTIPAKYENGVFRPLEAVQIEEGTVVEVHVPSSRKPGDNRRSIKDLPFFGMWKDREDIGDGVEYVNWLRDNPRRYRDNGSLPSRYRCDDRRLAR
jgi:predicted DNA-binding antitoxin AbrB/MazE fold protein